MLVIRPIRPCHGLNGFWFLLLSLLALSPAKAQRVFVNMVGDNGSSPPAKYNFTPQTGRFTGQGKQSKINGPVDSATVQYTDKASKVVWTFNFDTSTLPSPLAIGNYRYALLTGYGPTPGRPVLSITNSAGLAATDTNGEFTVLDAQFALINKVYTIKSFAVKFAQHYLANPYGFHGVLLFESKLPDSAVIDTTPPQTTATISGRVLTLHSSDPEGSADVSGSLYQINHGAITGYSGPFTLTGSPGQTATITCWSEDLVGNQEAPHDTVVTIGATGAVNQVVLHSEAGDRIGGLDQTINSDNGTLSTSTYTLGAADLTGQANYVTLSYMSVNDYSHSWTLSFATNLTAAPLVAGYYTNARLATGLYDDPFIYPGTGAGQPGLAFGLYANGVYSLSGAFQIIDIAYDTSGPQPQVTRLKGRFVQHSGGIEPALRGVIEFDATPDVPADTSAPVTTAAISGNLVTLLPADPDDKNDIDRTYYQVDHGATRQYFLPFLLYGPVGASHTITCWSTDIAGNKETPHDISLVTTAAAAPASELEVYSQFGDDIGGGANYFYNTTTGTFGGSATIYTTISSQVNRVGIGYSDKLSYNGGQWLLAFDASPLPAPLLPGYYNHIQGAQDYPLLPGRAIEEIDGLYYRPSYPTGGYQIVEANYDYTTTPPTLVSFAARFVQHDGGQIPGLYGSIHYHSATPIPVDTTPPVTSATIARNIVTLSATDPDSPNDTDQSFYQIDHGVTQVYTGPFVLSGDPGSTHLVTIWSDDIAGTTETPRDIPFVIDGSGVFSRLVLHSEPGDSIGLGRDYVFNTDTGVFTANAGVIGAAKEPVDSAGVSYTDYNKGPETWNVLFNTNLIPTPLVPGYYPGAYYNYYADPLFVNRPTLFVTGDNRSSYNSFTGAFEVFDAVYDTSVYPIRVLRFAARFAQHTNSDASVAKGIDPAIYGIVQYNSDTPIPTDTSAPTTTVSDAQNRITLVITDPDSNLDVDRTYYRIDGGDIHVYNAPFLLYGEPGSSHTLTCWSSDIAGNKETPHDTVVAIDSAGYFSSLTLSVSDGHNLTNYAVNSNTGVFSDLALLSKSGDGVDTASVSYGDATFTSQISLYSGAIPALLKPGYYPQSQYYYYAQPGHLGLLADIQSLTYGAAGAIEIFDAGFDTSVSPPRVTHLAARFVTHDGIYTTRGLLRYNSDFPIPTDTSAPTTTAVVARNSVTLSVTDPDSNQDIDQTYYKIDHGLTRVYSGPFLVSGAGGSAHTVTIWSVDIVGNQEAPHDISVVIDPGGLQTYLALQSQAGDPIGLGGNYLFNTNTGYFTVTKLTGSPFLSSATLTYTDTPTSVYANVAWSVNIATDQLGRPLDIGNYDYTAGFYPEKPGQPALLVYGNGKYPYLPTGRFTIFDFGVDYSGAAPVLTRLGATFEQHTNGSQPALYGVLRYNSSVAPPPPSPFTTAALSAPVPASGWYSAPVQVSLSAENPYNPGAIAAIYDSLDGAAAQSYSAPVLISGDGKHTFSFYSVDAQGIREPIEHQPLWIDATPPVVTVSSLTSKPANGPTEVTIKGVFADATSGIVPSSLVCNVLEETINYRTSINFTVQGDGSFSQTFNVPSASSYNKKLKFRLTLIGQDIAGNTVSKTMTLSLTGDPVAITQ